MFRDSQGNTRIRFLWDQTLTPAGVDQMVPEGAEEYANIAQPPEGFAVGVEFDKARIDAALRSLAPKRLVPSIDSTGHGTAVGGLAAGGGRRFG